MSSKDNENAIFCGCQGGNEEATEAYREIRRGTEEEVNAGRREKAHSKKHACPDCSYCQWCGDDRCRICRDCRRVAGRKLSLAGQIALYEAVNAGRTIQKK
jgi:hypothetical protein